VPNIRPWLLRAAQFDLGLYEIGSKSYVSPDAFRSRFNENNSVFGGFRTTLHAVTAADAVTESVVFDN
jgi:hypothetical protein